MSPSLCVKYGLGSTASGIYLFFVFFGLTMLLLQLCIGIVNVWLTGHLPKIVLVARAHGVSPWRIFQNMLARSLRALTRRVAHALQLDVPRLTPLTVAAILQFRASRGRTPPAGVPERFLTIASGDVVELHIDEVVPRTTCFVQANFELLTIQWARDRFISLHTVESAQLIRKRRNTASLRTANTFRQLAAQFSQGARATRSTKAARHTAAKPAAEADTTDTRGTGSDGRISAMFNGDALARGFNWLTG
eukprot:7384345-Prymnesium_polylepis.1